jgi:hypothetical protein
MFNCGKIVVICTESDSPKIEGIIPIALDLTSDVNMLFTQIRTIYSPSSQILNSTE